MQAREQGEAVAGTASGLRVADYAEDATGFGALELRTVRDLVVRPRDVLDAYMTHGSTGGGRYARPVRLYLGLCGVLMFYLFLIGGTERLLFGVPPDLLDDLIARSGKSREAFMNDADGWMTLTSTPILSFFYALGVVPLLKWWMGVAWRPAFRATFALLCAWTVPMLLLGPLPYMPRFAVASSFLIWAFLILAFVRMGRGRWWTGPWQAAGRCALLLVGLTIAGFIGMFPATGVALLGGFYGT